MLYDINNPILEITDVVHLRWQEQVCRTNPRSYSALAMRIHGNATIQTEHGEYFVNPKDILYLPQGTAYDAIYSDTEIIAIHFITKDTDADIEVYSPANWEDIHTLFQKALHLWKLDQAGLRPYMFSVVYKILGRLSENATEYVLPSSLILALSYIREHYTESNLPISTICDAAGIGQTALRQAFWKYQHQTPVEYINNLRLEHARDLIAQGSSVENAAYQSGFNDPKYFSRIAKKHFGCTPRELKLYGK